MVRKTNFQSISVLVSWIATFMSKKRSSLWISHKMLQNKTKAWFISLWLTLWRKTVFVNIYPLLMVWSNQFFKQIQIFLRICHYSNMVKKKTFWVFQWSFLRLSLLCLKRKVLYEFPQKCFKTTERHSLAICGLGLWRKTVFVNIYPIFLIWSKKVV